ncbi:MAG: hypothetical protein IT305_32595 [Chloroflexi bacterium]|nr:hypothetical protein [Chloroflexota bacterium]
MADTTDAGHDSLEAGQGRPLTRRQMLRQAALGLTLLVGGTSLLVGCQQAPTSTAPQKPAESSKPAGASKLGEAAKPAAAASTQAPAAAKPAAPGKVGGTLIVGRKEDASSLDPQNGGGLLNAFPIISLYESLISLDQQGQIVPSLTESYSWSGDNKVLTLKLRSGIKFHDGTPVDAQAVKWSLDRTRDPERGKTSFADWKIVSEVQAQGTDTVSLTFQQPSASFLVVSLAGFGGSIVSKAGVEKFGAEFQKQAVGTGPFTLKEWVPGDHITLAKNPNYSTLRKLFKNPGAPLLDEVSLRVIPEDQTRMAALETGQIHVDHRPTPRDLKRLAGDPRFVIISANRYAAVRFLNFEITKPPFDDIKVRQAFSHAVDPTPIVDKVWEGSVVRNFNMVPPGHPGHSPEMEKVGYSFDPTKAARLLDEAGWTAGSGGTRTKDGKPLEILFWTYPEMEGDAQIILNQVERVGFKVKIESLEYGTFRSRLKDAVPNVITMSFNRADSSVLWSMYTWAQQAPISRWKDDNAKKFMALVEQGDTITDPAKRAPIYLQAQKLMVEQAVVVPMYSDGYSIVARKEVKDLLLDTSGLAQLVLFNDASLG